MNYKKILKSRKFRLKILQALSFIPDKTMIKLQYRIKTGRKLNLKNPQRFTEKLQWYKLYYKNPLMIQCVDKYDVREYIKSLGLESILNECYGVFDSPEEIDFNLLPNQFVLKDTLGGGGNDIIICKDKTKADLNAYRKIMHEWVETKLVKSGGREWSYYSGKKHRIIAEKYIECENGDLPDYKFFCFNGEPYCLYTMIDYAKNHDNGRLGFFDTDFKLMPYYRKDFKPITEQIPKPKNFDLMVKYARILSKGFPHVRVDLYNINGRIVFGELTFYNASGYMSFEPDEFDFVFGEMFELSNEERKDIGISDRNKVVNEFNRQ